MQLLLSPTLSAATALNAKATAYFNGPLKGQCGTWSDIYSDGTRFAVVFDNSIQGAFSDAELGTTFNYAGIVSYDNVTQGDPQTTAQDGTVTGTWSVVPPPAPPSP